MKPIERSVLYFIVHIRYNLPNKPAKGEAGISCRGTGEIRGARASRFHKIQRKAEDLT